MRITSFLRGSLSTGGIGEAASPKSRRQTHKAANPFRAGRAAAERGDSRLACHYRDPDQVAKWLMGFDSGQPVDGVVHGYSRYKKHGCRCAVCVEAYRAHQRRT